MAAADPTAQGADPRRPVTARGLIVIGGGEHAVVVAEAAASRPDCWQVVGFSDPSQTPHAAGRGPDLLHLGGDEMLAITGDQDSGAAPALVLGIGGGIRPGLRQEVVDRLGADRDWATIVHRDASVSRSARLGAGTMVGAGAVIQAGVVAGRHVIVNTGATIEHDVVLGDYAHVAPAAAIGGGTRIGAGVFVGLGAVVRDHVAIGDEATIGMGAVVVGDVQAGAVLVGVPARPQATSRNAPGTNAHGQGNPTR